MNNEDLMFHWAMLSSRVDDEVGKGMLMNLYITIRGFSFARSCLELYKQAYQKKLQKSKSLRHEVQQASAKDDNTKEATDANEQPSTSEQHECS